MGDAPGVPVGSGCIRRVPDDRLSDVDDRDAKKARGSRWGPPKLDNPLSNDRPAPIITSLVREVDYHADSGRSGYSSPPRQLPLLQSSPAVPPRYDDWSRNVPSSRGISAGWPHSDSMRSSQPGSLGEHNASPCHPVAMPRPSFPGSSDRQGPGNRVPGTSGEICRNFLAARCTFGDRCWYGCRLILYFKRPAERARTDLISILVVFTAGTSTIPRVSREPLEQKWLKVGGKLCCVAIIRWELVDLEITAGTI